MQLKKERSENEFRVDVDQNLDLDANRNHRPIQPPCRNLFPANNQTTNDNQFGHISLNDIQSITVSSELENFEERQDCVENEYGGRNGTHQNEGFANSSYPKLCFKEEYASIETQQSPFTQRPTTTPTIKMNQQSIASQRLICPHYDSYGNRITINLTTPQSMHNTQKSFYPQGSFKIVPNTARSDRSLAQNLNKELKQYFSNKKARKASSRRRYPTNSKKQLIPVPNLLWVESLNENLTQQLEKERRAHIDKQKQQIVKDSFNKPDPEDRQAPHKDLNTMCGTRSKSRNDTNIYDGPTKPLSELHKQLKMHQEKQQKTRNNKHTATQPTLNTISKSRANKLFQILTNEIGQGASSAPKNRQQFSRYNSLSPGYENLSTHQNPFEQILQLTGKQLEIPGMVTKNSSIASKKCDQKLRQQRIQSTLQKPRIFTLSDKILSLKSTVK